MSRRRRAIVLLGLALLLGGIAAGDVASREAAADRRLGPLVRVLVTRSAVSEGGRLTADYLAARSVPSRFVPPGALHDPGDVVGLQAAGPLPAGSYLTPASVRDSGAQAPPGAPVRAGERVAQVIAQGSPEAIAPGSRVDVLVTREARGGAPGRTALALQDVEVISATAAPAGGGGGEQGSSDGALRVAASLRVSLRQAVYLAAAQSFARELRLLPRAAGDRGHADDGLAVDDRLG